MAVKFSNNASTQLSAAITTSATSVVVVDSSELPTLSAGDHTYVTLADAGGTKIEVVKVTAIASNTLTVIRGQDNTSALAFSAGDLCELRLTAALLTDTSTLQTGAEIKTAYETEVSAFTDTQFTKLAGIEAAADITDTTNVVGALTAGTNVAITAGGTISSTDTTYSVGDGGLTQVNFTTADNTKLDGIATSANNYSHPTSEHLPSTVSQTEAGYLNGVTGAIQTQLDAKQASDATIVVDADIGVNVQAYDADTSKTDVAETRTASINMADNVLQRPELKNYSETKVAMGANDVDLSAGNVFTKTISGNQTLTFSNPPATGKGGAFTLILTNGGSATVTWPASVDWAAATAPTLTAAGVDVLTFTTIDAGTIWYGIASGIGMG
jgi:hypothetical protein